MPLLILLLIVLIIAFLIYKQKPQEQLPMVDVHIPLPASTTTLQNKNVLYVDVRTPEEFAAGSVRGAVNIPVDEIVRRLAEFQNKEKIVVFCRSGNRSSQAKSILDKAGIQNVVDGGSWQEVAKNSQ